MQLREDGRAERLGKWKAGRLTRTYRRRSKSSMRDGSAGKTPVNVIVEFEFGGQWREDL
jgi:hypothetical protein